MFARVFQAFAWESFDKRRLHTYAEVQFSPGNSEAAETIPEIPELQSHVWNIFRDIPAAACLSSFFFSPTHVHQPTHCSVFMGPVSQIRNACVKNGDFSFSRGVKLHYGCVWLRKRDVFLTYRDLCLFFFLFFSFPLEECVTWCHFTHQCNSDIRKMSSCSGKLRTNINKNSQFAYETVIVYFFPFLSYYLSHIFSRINRVLALK